MYHKLVNVITKHGVCTSVQDIPFNPFWGWFSELVGRTYPSDKYDFVSWDDDIPNMWKNNQNLPTTNQNQCVFAGQLTLMWDTWFGILSMSNLFINFERAYWTWYCSSLVCCFFITGLLKKCSGINGLFQQCSKACYPFILMRFW